MIFSNYNRCSTCINAKKHVISLNVDFVDQDITQGIPYDQLKQYVEKSGLDINKFFNTSGNMYKENNFKEKIKTMSYEEKLKALSENGMLIKRPILVGDDFVLVGYKPEVYEQVIKHE